MIKTPPIPELPQGEPYQCQNIQHRKPKTVKMMRYMMINKKMSQVPDLPQGECPQDGLGNSLLLTPVQGLKGADVGSCLIAPCLPSIWPVITTAKVTITIITTTIMMVICKRSSYLVLPDTY